MARARSGADVVVIGGGIAGVSAAAAEPTFVWCVGQGGYGIQSAAAVGQLTAELALGLDHAWTGPADVDVSRLLPDRLRAEGVA
jgi:glycine/D-amino acid oxidase-like deaminating enzyme